MLQTTDTGSVQIVKTGVQKALSVRHIYFTFMYSLPSLLISWIWWVRRIKTRLCSYHKVETYNEWILHNKTKHCYHFSNSYFSTIFVLQNVSCASSTSWNLRQVHRLSASPSSSSSVSRHRHLSAEYSLMFAFSAVNYKHTGLLIITRPQSLCCITIANHLQTVS